MAISNKDLAILKLSYTTEEFDLLETALAHEPALVATAVAKASPTHVGDTAAYDRIICSLFVHARDEYENDGDLPLWAEKWFNTHYSSVPYHQFYECSLFSGASRYDGIKLVSLP